MTEPCWHQFGELFCLIGHHMDASGNYWRNTNITICDTKSVLKPDEIGNVTEEVVDLARNINLKVNSDDVQELLDSYNQELSIDELIEIHEQEQDIEELESSHPVQSEYQNTVGNLTKGLSLIEKG
ncbi:hypothetical protein TNCV_2081811 [Trichonephila clavipes]|nr:hypothetical protein TNCV_2081811 [Trichonephila clavipes]